MSFELTVHRHGAASQNITRHVVSWAYGRSRDTTASESLAVMLKLTLFEASYVVRVGNWLVLRDAQGKCASFGYVTHVDAGLTRDGDTLVSDQVKVSTISWFDLLTQAGAYVPLGWAESVGTMFNLKDWKEVISPILQHYAEGKIGFALQQLLRKIGRVRLPETMGGEFIGDAIPVVYDEGTRKAYAPSRVVEEVARTGGMSQAFTANVVQTGVGEFIQSIFVPDRTLVEMFSSLEDQPDGLYEAPPRIPTTTNVAEGTLDVIIDPDHVPEGGYRAASKLAAFLQRRPVLIYRTPPWRKEPLAKAAIAKKGFRELNDAERDRLVPTNGFDGRSGFPQVTDTTGLDQGALSGMNYRVSNQVALLEKLYSEVTWDTRRAIEIPARYVRAFKARWSDRDRVNLTTVSIAPGGQPGVEAADIHGLPITNDESILNHGARVQKPQWPFTLQFKDNQVYQGPLVNYLRSLAAQVMQFQQNAHAMAAGTFSLNMTDAHTPSGRALDIPAGEIIAFKFDNTIDTFHAYTHSVEHQWSRGERGAETAATKITYVRGVFGHEEQEVRGAKVPLGSIPTSSGRPLSGTAQGSPRRHPDVIPRPYVELGAWTGLSAINDPAQAVATAGRAGLQRLSVFVNDLAFTSGAWRTYDAAAVIRAGTALRDAGHALSLASWLTPAWATTDNMSRLAELALRAGANEIDFDLEGPWVTSLRSASDTRIADLTDSVFEGLKAGGWRRRVVCNCIVYTDLRVVGPFISRCATVYPQAYRVTANASTRDRIERIAADRFASFGVEVGMGVAAYEQSNPFVPGNSDELTLALREGQAVGARRARVWRLEFLSAQLAGAMASFSPGTSG